MGLLNRWTIRKAAGAGIVAGAAALMLWPLYAIFQQSVLIPFLLALAVTALCGLSVLWITFADLLLHRRRGQRLRPIRVFDVGLGLLLTVPSLLELRTIVPDSLG